MFVGIFHMSCAGARGYLDDSVFGRGIGNNMVGAARIILGCLVKDSSEIHEYL